MIAKIEALANADTIGLKTQHLSRSALQPTRQFLYGIFSWRGGPHGQTPTEIAIAIKKHFPIEDFPAVRIENPGFDRPHLPSVNHLGLRLGT